MRYIKLYEEFRNSEIELERDVDLSDKTIDDVLADDFFDSEEDEEDTYKNNDKDSPIIIKNWKTY